MTLDWDKLKPGFDIRSNFEELCCQLARYETVPPNSQFIRKAAPDSGMECFWKLPDGSEWGWQAKYFRTSPLPSQWKQINNSVKKALDTHPNLRKYTICLPIDRNDARISHKKSFLEKWNDQTETWKQIKNIEFEYWGTSEIEEKLSDEKHSGRIKYFFDKEFLSSEWFERKLKESIKNAGPRYSKEMNIKLEIAKSFDALGRTSEFQDILKNDSKNIDSYFSYIKNYKTIYKTIEFDKLDSKIYSITNILKNTDKLEQNPIGLEKIHKECIEAIELTSEINLKLHEEAKNTKKDKNKGNVNSKFSGEIHHLLGLQKKLEELENAAKSNFYQIANTGALLLIGNAGNGKTHLLCDVANQRIKSKRFSVLLHGNHFINDNPKKQILEELDLNCTFDEFLGALDAAGQTSNSKALIMIDALNEGEGRQIWPKYLAGLLQTISKYPWVGIAISVRTSYEKDVIPEQTKSEALTKFVHNGFKYNLEEAIGIFFDKNGIQRPHIPLLVPEFYNPQFLLILCKGLLAKNLTKIPSELKGLTSVYDFFIDAINEKLSRANMLDYSQHDKIVHKAVECLAEHMASKNVRYLPYQDANTLLNKIYQSNTGTKSLIHHLCSEGLLSIDKLRVKSDACESVVQFAYERLGDNLIIANQLKDIKTKQDARKLFHNTGILQNTLQINGLLTGV